MVDDLVQRLHDLSQYDTPSTSALAIEAADALARRDAEIAALKLERDDFANACEHSADDLRARDAEIAELRKESDEWLEMSSAVAVSDSSGKAVGGFGPNLWPCNWRQEIAMVAFALVQSMQRAERAEARVREAQTVTIAQMPSSAFGVFVLEPEWVGKRVALVLLDTEEAK